MPHKIAMTIPSQPTSTPVVVRMTTRIAPQLSQTTTFGPISEAQSGHCIHDFPEDKKIAARGASQYGTHELHPNSDYGNVDCAFDFLPGAAGGVNPANRQLMPSIFTPCSNRIRWHDIMSPFAVSSDKRRRTLASEMPTASAISVSSRSPCVFRYCKMPSIDLLPKAVPRMVKSIYPTTPYLVEVNPRLIGAHPQTVGFCSGALCLC
jgi:hypothetical protein